MHGSSHQANAAKAARNSSAPAGDATGVETLKSTPQIKVTGSPIRVPFNRLSLAEGLNVVAQRRITYAHF